MSRATTFIIIVLSFLRAGAQTNDWMLYYRQTDRDFTGPRSFIDSLGKMPPPFSKEVIESLYHKHGNTARVMLSKAIYARENGFLYEKNDWRTWWARTLEEATRKDEMNVLFAGFFYFGDLYNAMQNVDTATFYLMKAADIARKAGYRANKETNLGILVSHALYRTRNYRECADYCLEILPDTASKEPLAVIAILNNLGLSYKRLAQYDSAQYYFRETADYAFRHGIKVWWGIATGNIGDALYEQGREPEAISYWKADYDSCMKYGEPLSAFLSGAFIGRYEFKNGNRLKAMADVQHAFRQSTGKSLVNELAISEILGGFYTELGKKDSAAYFKDFHGRLRDSLSVVHQRNNYSFLKLKLDYENSQQEAQTLVMEKETEVRRRNILLVSLLVMGLVSAFLYNRQRKKMHSVSRQETGSAEELVAKESLVGKTLLTDHDWLNFKDTFERLYPGFFERLKATAPGVTSAETRLAALMKLNLGSKEMAVMQGISPGAVRVTKSRLRTRLSLSARDSLEEFIQKL